MACRVPGCATKARHKLKRHRLFKAITEVQLEDWQAILLRFGVDNFTENDMICILHFKETDIELERTVYKFGGEAFQVLLKRPALRHNAVPTIFKSNSLTNEKNRKFNYAQKLNCETIAEQKRIFEAAQRLEYETVVKQKVIPQAAKEKTIKEEPLQEVLIKEEPLEEMPIMEEPIQEISIKEEPVQEISIKEEPLQEISIKEEPIQEMPVKEKSMKRAVKRKESSDFMGDEDSVVNTKFIKSNNIFQELLRAVGNNEKLPYFLGKARIGNVSERNCIRWSVWKEDLSSEEKVITLFEDLTVNVFAYGKNIVLSKFKSVVDWRDLRNLFREVVRVLPCMKSDCQSKEARDACLGFVTESDGRPVLRCAPCKKNQRKYKRKILSKVKKTGYSKRRKRI
ncbi:uncharacterized protein LOC117174390 [Belonocnema kinseyi]|uniref:uncharacterized protein LOC117174390 n=1 Tax=Belonocnema kinseyi TaxID=2817044 RepID=UPI00143D1768|nr:uncharacterized protein LOC117174390 [Belonocnema kinseyi]